MATSAPIRNISAIKFVTIHHSAVVPPAMDLATLKQRASSYNATHKAKSYALLTKGEFGYDAISYHYLVSQKGHVLQVQDIKYERNHAGDRVRGVNSHNIYGVAICLDSDTTKYKVSDSAKNAIAKIIYDLEVKLKKSLIVRTHRQQAVHPTTGALPEKTGVIYTQCAGDTMGTNTKGTCKEIIDLVNKMHNDASTPPVKPPVTPPPAPVDPKDQKIKDLEKEITRLNGVIDIKDGEIKTMRDEATEDSKLISRITDERDTFERNYLKAVEQLNAQKEKAGFLDSLTQWLKSIFGK